MHGPVIVISPKRKLILSKASISILKKSRKKKK